MKLWGGRFTKETDKLVNNFNASISFDQKFYKGKMLDFGKMKMAHRDTKGTKVRR